MTTEVVRHRTARSFLQRAGSWLLEAEDQNNLILSLTYEVAEEEDSAEGVESGAVPSAPFFATVEEESQVVGCVFRSPPHQVLLTDMPSHAPALVARTIADAYAAIPAVLGPPPLAESFARAWASLRRGGSRPGADQRLYRLDEVTLLGAPGRLRLGRAEEAALATAWAGAFTREVHMHFGPSEERVAAWIERGCLFIWEHEDEPVSMAVAHGHTPSGVRVGYVYTPPERRRQGYAGACVSAVSRRLLDAGRAFCVLYADLSNPTTNALYQRMGYRPVADVRDHHFRTEAPS